MLSISNRLPIFFKNNKFDSFNWITFKTIVIIIIKVWDTIDHLNRSICNPTISLPNILDNSLQTTKIIIAIAIASILWDLDWPLVDK